MIHEMTQQEAAKTAATAYTYGTASQLYDAHQLYLEASKIIRDDKSVKSSRDIAMLLLGIVYSAGVMEGKREERARRKKAE